MSQHERAKRKGTLTGVTLFVGFLLILALHEFMLEARWVQVLWRIFWWGVVPIVILLGLFLTQEGRRENGDEK